MKYLIAITHADPDQKVASAIRQALEDARMKCEYLSPVSSGRKSDKLLDKSDALVLVLSASANDAVGLSEVVERAANADKIIIPVRLDDTPLSKRLEFYLSTPHWLDASAGRLEEHLEELVLTLRRNLDRPRSSKKSKVSLLLGVFSLLLFGGVLGPPAILLGIAELRSARSSWVLVRGRIYAWIGIVTGFIGTVGWIVLMVRWYYWDINPSQDLMDWLGVE